MQSQTIPYTRDLVLIGGGHTHALILRRWATDPLPGTRVTVINPDPRAAYSGMLPGFIAGHYTRDELDIDLVKLAQHAGARLVTGRASGIDRVKHLVQIQGHPAVGYDVLSVDVGITSEMPDLEGFSRHAVPAKPLSAFAGAWSQFAQESGPAEVAVLGGGVAGVELAMAMMHRLRTSGREASVTIIEKNVALSALGDSAARRIRDTLNAQSIRLMEHCTATEIHSDRVVLDSGAVVAAGFVTGAAGARPWGWLARTGLADEAGFIPVDTRLRSRDPLIFAVGDCAEMTASPRPKAGVFAVRQAPVLFRNLRAALSETGGMKPYRPQKDYLKLISLGRKSALAERFGQAFSGPVLWRWKDHIDRKFMDQFDRLTPPSPPALPWPRAGGAGASTGEQPVCGGCGSKIGPRTLQNALGTGQLGDDAAVLQTGSQQQVISTDHLRAFVSDPVVMTRIAAVHALGDIWAMGADPQAALASVILPHQSPALAERQLAEIMQAAQEVMRAAGAEITGGHSTLGAELTIGFTVTGLCTRDPVTLAGARPGDRLILTKPLGSGVIMAAHMQGRAAGADVIAAQAEMMKPQGGAARILARASAMTDVTGFGLAGHLRNICKASGTGARIDTARVPLMDGALTLSEKGIRSTLWPENRAGFDDVPDHPRAALLFDPQTAGGLLAAVPGDADDLCAQLSAKGYAAAVIGEITEEAFQIVTD